MNWHHHHITVNQILFCFTESEDEWPCEEAYDGEACPPNNPHGTWSERLQRWERCRYHLAWGDYVVDTGEQLALVTHLEAAPPPGETPQ